jgi:hypothetical protein
MVSQEIDSLQNTYQSYFELPRETLYTHLNKTTFLSGENIWFKTYAYDRHDNLPSMATTNINVGVFDSKGKLIKNKLWLAINGGAIGNFLIDSTFVSGEYYIKASTNWMRNFEESDAFVQKIQVIANDYDKNKSDTKINSYDFQFLPESGHLISEANNTLGFKIINANGRGVKITGSIYDDSNQEITTFKTNNFGIGKCLFNPIFGKSYTAKISLPNGTTLTKQIEDIKPQGIILNTNSLRSNELLVNVITNQTTLKAISNKTYTLLIHKDGKSKSIDFSFEASEQKSFIIPKQDLFEGITIITLFDDHNTPIAERLIYNHSTQNNASAIGVNQLKIENDSIYFSLFKVKNKKSTGLTNLSISVLPQSTQSYEPDHNIFSANHLRPYVKGHIEKPNYYFKDLTPKTLYELDLLLLTQGWSRYNWNSIFNNKPKVLFEFENGVTLEGKINSTKKITNLRLQDPKLIGFQWSNIKVENDNTFVVKKYFPIVGETIRLAYYDKNGKLIKPDLYVRCRLNEFNTDISQNNLVKNNAILTEASLPSTSLSEGFFYDNLVELDEVLIKTKEKKKKVESMGLKINNVTSKDNYTTITQDEVTNFPTVVDFIMSKGYMTARNSQFGGLQIVSNRVSTLNGSQSPQIFLDDIPLSDIDILITLPTSEIEGILVDKSGLGSGINGANGIIRIYSRRTPLNNFGNTAKAFSHTSKANVGFSEPKVFYNPKYKSYQNDLFKFYGTVSWIPNIYLNDDDASQVVKIPNTNTSRLNFYIEGFDTSGNFYSEIKTIELIKPN